MQDHADKLSCKNSVALLPFALQKCKLQRRKRIAWHKDVTLPSVTQYISIHHLGPFHLENQLCACSPIIAPIWLIINPFSPLGSLCFAHENGLQALPILFS